MERDFHKDGSSGSELVKCNLSRLDYLSRIRPERSK